jgi:hypothetical protein
MIIATDASDPGGAETLHRYELDGAYDEMFRAVDRRDRKRRPEPFGISAGSCHRCASQFWLREEKPYEEFAD